MNPISKFHIGKRLCNVFPIQNGLREMPYQFFFSASV